MASAERSAALVSGPEQRLALRPWAARKLDDLGELQYHTVLASVGYEPRSSAIARMLPRPRVGVAVGFETHREHAYDDNARWYDEAHYNVSDDWGEAFPPLVRRLLTEAAQEPGRRVAVDISSMERPRIAAVVHSLATLSRQADLEVDLLYAPAQFRPPGDLPSGTLSLTCVSAFFIGRLQSASELADPVALVGLGYEPYKAAGALQSLEVDRAVALVPEGFDERFLPEVLEANKGLLAGPDPPDQLRYPVADPAECVALLDGQIHALRARGATPLLLPLGPKIFTANACLAAAMHHPHVAVWRASFLEREDAVPHHPDGNVCGVTFTRRPAEQWDE